MILVIHGDHRFEGAGGGVGKLVEFLGDFGDVEAMGDPVLQIDFSVSDDLDDLGEVCGKGIAAGHDGEFTAVEEGCLWEGKVLRGDADINHTSSNGSVLMALHHGTGVTGGVDDDVAKSTSGDRFNFRKV